MRRSRRQVGRIAIGVVAAAVVAAAVVAAAVVAVAGAVGRGHARAVGSAVSSARAEHKSGARVGGWWVSTWGTSPQPQSRPAAPGAAFNDQTVRNVIFTSIGGASVRVRFSNVFGTRPLQIGRAAIAAAGAGPGATVGRGLPLRFAGRSTALIPRGRDVVSDPAPLRVRPLERLTVSLYLPRPSGPATWHAVARQNTYVAAGDHTLDVGAGAFTHQVQSWYFVDDVAVQTANRHPGTLVALGDSVTDGVGSRLGADAGWPNDLARRLDARRSGGALGIVDDGIAGNRVLTSAVCCGPSALARFGHDVLDRPAVREVILLEGTNDIGMSRSTDPLSAPHTNVSAAQIIAGDEQIIRRAHAAGLKVFGGTLLPFRGAWYWTPAGEAKRQAVNQWILTSGAFDGTIDFARAVADPADPQALAPAYDSGDHLHPDDAGYRAMADAINLAMLLRPGHGPG